MQKKPSGLGRGLDELLEDNTPSARSARTSDKPLVIARGEAKENDSKPRLSSLYDMKAKSLYDEKPKTRSVKSNFK